MFTESRDSNNVSLLWAPRYSATHVPRRPASHEVAQAIVVLAVAPHTRSPTSRDGRVSGLRSGAEHQKGCKLLSHQSRVVGVGERCRLLGAATLPP